MTLSFQLYGPDEDQQKEILQERFFFQKKSVPLRLEFGRSLWQ